MALFRDRDKYESVNSVTIKSRSIKGNIYVTVGCDENGIPLEIFLTQGKAGTNEAAYAAALGRTISLGLQAVPVEAVEETLRRFILTLWGIQGDEQEFVGDGERILSIPDAVAKALSKFYEMKYHESPFGKPTVPVKSDP